MAFDAFVKIDGIPGEALDEQYRTGSRSTDTALAPIKALPQRPAPVGEPVPVGRR